MVIQEMVIQEDRWTGRSGRCIPGFTGLLTAIAHWKNAQETGEKQIQGATVKAMLGGTVEVKLLFLPVADSPPADRGK
jgi:hypothetical protein